MSNNVEIDVTEEDKVVAYSYQVIPDGDNELVFLRIEEDKYKGTVFKFSYIDFPTDEDGEIDGVLSFKVTFAELIINDEPQIELDPDVYVDFCTVVAGPILIDVVKLAIDKAVDMLDVENEEQVSE